MQSRGRGKGDLGPLKGVTQRGCESVQMTLEMGGPRGAQGKGVRITEVWVITTLGGRGALTHNALRGKGGSSERSCLRYK